MVKQSNRSKTDRALRNVNVDITKLKVYICDSCKHDRCVPLYQLRNLPALLSPTGKEQVVRVEVGFACAKCGKPMMLKESMEE